METESPKPETDIPCLDGRQPGEPREGGGMEREPHPPQAEEGDQSSREKGLPDSMQPPADKREDGERKAPGQFNESETQSRRPPCDSGRGNRKGEATQGGPSETINRRESPSTQESGIHRDGKSHSDPIIGSGRSRRTCQNRGTAWQRIRGRWRSRQSNNTKRRHVNKQRKQDTVPSCKETESTTVESSHIMVTRRR